MIAFGVLYYVLQFYASMKTLTHLMISVLVPLFEQAIKVNTMYAMSALTKLVLA